MTQKDKAKMLKGIMAGYAAMVEDSVPSRSGPSKGQQGGWKIQKSTRDARGVDPEAWARYQRRVEGVW